MILEHHGARKFDLKKFNKITNNDGWNKPNGGLWTCPINSVDNWKDWCLSENFRTKSLRTRMILELRSKKILKIDSYTDLRKKFIWFKRKLGRGFVIYYPDFEKMAALYDAIHLTSKGQSRTRFSRPLSLYGWDVECVLVLNGKKLKQIKISDYKKSQKVT